MGFTHIGFLPRLRVQSCCARMQHCDVHTAAIIRVMCSFTFKYQILECLHCHTVYHVILLHSVNALSQM